MFFLHPFYQPFHFVQGVFPAGIFFPVGGDDHDGVFRFFVFRQAFLYFPDVFYAFGYRVQQGGAAPGVVFFFGEGFYLFQWHAVVDYVHFAVEQDGVYDGISFHVSLFFDQTVVAADGFRFQSAHGSAAVKNEEHFR